MAKNMRSLVAILTLVALFGCADSRPNQWNAYVYPFGVSGKHVKLAGFVSFEACKAAATSVLNLVDTNEDGGSFECGYKCAPYSDTNDLDLCKETRD